MLENNESLVSNILIAEDHELYSDGISLLLNDLFPLANIIRAVDFDKAWTELHNNQSIDLVLMDLKMPGTKGLNGVRAIKQTFPCHTIIVLSSLDSAISTDQIIALGVNGFISKSTQREKLKHAILSVLEGNVVIESDYYHSQTTLLSQRQQQTLNLMALGKSNKEIAKGLRISPNTVKEYVSIVCKELNAENRTQAVQKAQQLGLLFDIE